jgi:hypothetical protein
MAWAEVSRLPFVWWNTGLSPPARKSAATDEAVRFVTSQVRAMREELDFSVLGLCEISPKDLASIINDVGDPSLTAINATDRRGRLNFDTAILYDREKLQLISSVEFVEGVGKSTLKLGRLVSFAINGSQDIINVVASHWPSRLYLGEFASKRREFGTLLRASLDKRRNGSKRDYIVLMGDYNDDPFSPSLAEHLLATRDRELARRNARFFYNPFWRCLGESLPYQKAGSDESVCGTHFYPNGEHTEWFTYDQIIFSSAFLDEAAPIILSEEYTKIINTQILLKDLRDRRNFCDHFPVLSVATMRAQI